MAAGVPIIAYHKGGATETVRDGVTGTFFHDQSWEALAHVILNFDDTTFNAHTIAEHAHTFSRYQFKKNIRTLVESKWKNFALQNNRTLSKSIEAEIHKIVVHEPTPYSAHPTT